MHLFIIAGHGAGDPGATENGYTEAERVRAGSTQYPVHWAEAMSQLRYEPELVCR